MGINKKICLYIKYHTLFLFLAVIIFSTGYLTGQTTNNKLNNLKVRPPGLLSLSVK
jgi:hypothetical protein